MNLHDLPIRYAKTSARSLGMGGAAIAILGEPTLVSTNPAGLALFSFPAASLGQNFVRRKTPIPSHSCEDGASFFNHTQTTTEQTLVNVIVPAGRLKFAVFRETLLDLELNFESTSVLNFSADFDPFELLRTNAPSRRNTTSLEVVENAFAVGFSAFKNLYFGASLRLVKMEFSLLEQDYFASDFSPDAASNCIRHRFAPENFYLQRSVDARRWLNGGNVGALWRIRKSLSLGAYYTHRPGADVSTKIFLPAFHFAAAPQVSFPAAEDSLNWTFNLPDDFGFGFSWQKPNRLSLNFDLVRLFYRDFSAETIRAGASPDLDLDNQWQFRLGGEFISAKKRKLLFLPYEIQSLHLRAGYFNEPPSRLRSIVELEKDALGRTGQSHVLTAGFGVAFRSQGSGFRLDAGASYSSEELRILLSGVISIF